MGKRIQTDFPYPFDQLEERRVVGQVDTQHQGIDEEPDQRLQIGARASGNR